MSWDWGYARRARQIAAAYEKHMSEVYGYLGYRVRNREDAEDLTQRTFELAVRSWGRYDPRRGSLRAWLLAIARNVLIDHHRAETTRTSVAARAEMGTADHRAAASEEPVLGVSPELDAALQALDMRSREVIALRFGGDLTAREIAEVLNLSVANVEQILSRALRRLRAELANVKPASTSGG